MYKNLLAYGALGIEFFDNKITEIVNQDLTFIDQIFSAQKSQNNDEL